MAATRQTIRERVAGIKTRVSRVPIAEIIGNAQWELTQSRAGISAVTVKEYQERYEEGEKLPPITLFKQEVEPGVALYWVGDGFHRLRAQIRMQALDCEATIYEGGFLEALEWSLGSNDQHGMRRTPADKRQSAIIALRNPDLKQYSARTIAGICAVSSVFVDGIIASDFPDRIGGAKKGADGKLYPTGPKKLQGAGDGEGDEGEGGESSGAQDGGESTPDSGSGAGSASGKGTREAQPVEPLPPPPRTDAEGNILPEHLHEIFDTSIALDDNLEHLKNVTALLRKTIKAGTTQEDARDAALTAPLADEFATIDKELRLIHKGLKERVKPYAVCPYCKAQNFKLSRVSDLCRKCGFRDKENGVMINRGWVSYETYKSAPAMLKETTQTAEEVGYWAEYDAEADRSERERIAKEQEAERRRVAAEEEAAAKAEEKRLEREAKKAAASKPQEGELSLPNAAPKPSSKGSAAKNGKVGAPVEPDGLPF